VKRGDDGIEGEKPSLNFLSDGSSTCSGFGASACAA